MKGNFALPYLQSQRILLLIMICFSPNLKGKIAWQLKCEALCRPMKVT